MSAQSMGEQAELLAAAGSTHPVASPSNGNAANAASSSQAASTARSSPGHLGVLSPIVGQQRLSSPDSVRSARSDRSPLQPSQRSLSPTGHATGLGGLASFSGSTAGPDVAADSFGAIPVEETGSASPTLATDGVYASPQIGGGRVMAARSPALSSTSSFRRGRRGPVAAIRLDKPRALPRLQTASFHRTPRGAGVAGGSVGGSLETAKKSPQHASSPSLIRAATFSLPSAPAIIAKTKPKMFGVSFDASQFEQSSPGKGSRSQWGAMPGRLGSIGRQREPDGDIKKEKASELLGEEASDDKAPMPGVVTGRMSGMGGSMRGRIIGEAAARGRLGKGRLGADAFTKGSAVQTTRIRKGGAVGLGSPGIRSVISMARQESDDSLGAAGTPKQSGFSPAQGSALSPNMGSRARPAARSMESPSSAGLLSPIRGSLGSPTIAARSGTSPVSASGSGSGSHVARSPTTGRTYAGQSPQQHGYFPARDSSTSHSPGSGQHLAALGSGTLHRRNGSPSSMRSGSTGSPYGTERRQFGGYGSAVKVPPALQHGMRRSPGGASAGGTLAAGGQGT